MARSIKLKNENYIDSTGVVHNKKLLSDVIDNNGIVIAESKLASPSSTITVDGLNLQKDKHYKIEFYGASNVNGELYIRLNNINNLYNHIAIAANGTNTGNSNNNLVSVWRKNTRLIAYSMMLTNSNAMCILEMELILNEFSNGTSYKIYYGYPNTYSHAISLIYGSVDLDNHDNITSITFENSNGTFKVGTKVIVKK